VEVGPEVSVLEADQSAPRALFVLLESAVGTTDDDLASAALEELRAMLAWRSDPWRSGMLARSAAKLETGADAVEALFREALVHFTEAGSVLEVARTHLEYGEWLRRQRHRGRAVLHLDAARRHLAELGHYLHERAARELTLAETASRTTLGGLTVQELTVAQLAADGARNAEIARRMYLSRHTVDYHLRKVFQKLGIASRRDLAEALRDLDATPAPPAPPET
jgi:DNA-binding CsgD family transcriptional regulator